MSRFVNSHSNSFRHQVIVAAIWRHKAMMRKPIARLQLLSCPLALSLVLLPVAAQAQLNWAPTRGETAPLVNSVDPNLATQGQLTIGGLSCADVSPQKLPNRETPNPYGIPDDQWTPELFAALRARVQSCSASMSGNDRSFLRALLDNMEPSILARASMARSARTQVDTKKKGLLAQISALQNQTPAAEAVRGLRAFEQDFGSVQLPQQDKTLVASVLMRALLGAEAKAREEAEAETKSANARQAALQAEAQKQSDEFSSRMVNFSKPVQAFIKRNPSIVQIDQRDADAFLDLMYGKELSLLMCAKKFGKYSDEMQEITRRRKIFEAFVHEVLHADEAAFQEARKTWDLDTGKGPAADIVSSDLQRLQLTCDSALSEISSFLNFKD